MKLRKTIAILVALVLMLSTNAFPPWIVCA